MSQIQNSYTKYFNVKRKRVGSLFHNYREELSPDEARWWMSLAKKEYFHQDDRKITYAKEE